MKGTNQKARTANSTIDINVEGTQHGFLTVPCVSARSAFGTVQVPVCVLRNGEGPTITLFAGSHGDEFDGQVALHRLVDSIDIEDINGCLIIAPTLNSLATQAQSRCTPLDGKDLDQCFPGNIAGSITDQIAAVVFEHIIEPASLVIEFRSGGASTRFTSMAAVHVNEENAALQQKSEQSMIAFGAPYSARLLPSHTGSLAACAQAQDKEFVVIYLGGGASINASCLDIATIGCQNILVHAGILKHDLVLRATRMLEVDSYKNYVIAPSAGLLEMCRDIGEEVHMGNALAKIIQPGNTGIKPVVIKADRNGILMAHHNAGLIEQGDCVAIVADEVQR